MKKTTILIMSSILCVTMQSSVLASEKTVKAVKNSSDVYVGEDKVEIPAYNIEGYNYFKLRDIAYALNNSPKQFQVSWNEDKKSIELVHGEKYSVAGEELVGDNLLGQTEAIENESFIYVDGTKVNMSAYNIGGYTYFKLRDLSENLNFAVTWDGKNIGISKDKNNLETLTSVTPNEYRNMLGHGIDVDWVKTKQGREAYNEQAVKDFAKAGVSHVRVRITEDISDDLLNDLDKVVNDCLKNGVIPVIAYQGDDFKNKPNDKTLNKVVEWWSVIAERYKNVSAAVSFDIIIEVTDALNKDSDMINKLYENAVTEIRKTNPERIIMISPRLRSDPEYLSELKIPTKHNEHLMAEWHFYASGPSKTNEKKLWTTGTEAEKDIIRQKINTALKWETKTGIPTWVGAWMAGNYNDGNDYSIGEQTKFAEFVRGELDASGIPFSVNSDTAFYDRTNNKWINDMLPVFNAIFSSASTSVIEHKIDSSN